MHVVTVTWRFPDPTEPFVLNKVLGLLERGIDCTVVADPGQFPTDPRVRAILEGRVRTDGSLSALRYADVVHFEHAGKALEHRHLLRGIGAPKVVSCHGSDVLLETLGHPLIEEGFADVFSRVDRIHCVSEELAERCLVLGAQPRQLYVAPVGVDLHTFSPGQRRERSERLALRLISVGRLHWVKGYEYALEAVRLLVEEGHRLSYTIVGADEGAEGAIRLAIRDFGLEDVVTLTGHLPSDRIRDALGASDVFVLSSLSEGSSVATLEAMAMGLPVVVTDVGGNADIVTNGEHGAVVPARSSRALASAIAGLRHAEMRRIMGESARARAGAFDARRQIDAMVSLYDELSEVPARRVTESARELVSVVMVARDAADTIEDQLRALSLQDYDGPWEVVVVDNASSDGTGTLTSSWRHRLPGLRVVDAAEMPSIPYARNVGVREAHGSRIVMCDADDIVAPGWLTELAKALETDPLVCGVLERTQLLPAHISGEVHPVAADETILGDHRRRVLTGNIGFHREVFDRLGGFDQGLPRGEDLDFGWRAMDEGFEPRSVTGAVVHYRAQWRTRAVMHRGFVDGQAGPALYLRHRGGGMSRPAWPEIKHRYGYVVRRALFDVWSARARVEWAYELGFCVGRVVSSFRHRIVFP